MYVGGGDGGQVIVANVYEFCASSATPYRTAVNIFTARIASLVSMRDNFYHHGRAHEALGTVHALDAKALDRAFLAIVSSANRMHGEIETFSQIDQTQCNRSPYALAISHFERCTHWCGLARRPKEANKRVFAGS
jgi:hypothetical protein